MTQAILDVLRALVDAAFKAGSITDLAHTTLHGTLDDASAEAQAQTGPEPAPVPDAPVDPQPVPATTPDVFGG